MKMVNEKDRESKRGEIKEQAYRKYAFIFNSLSAKGGYADSDNILSSLLALAMLEETTKRNLLAVGLSESRIEESLDIARQEISTLMKMKEQGKFDSVINEKVKEMVREAEE